MCTRIRLLDLGLDWFRQVMQNNIQFGQARSINACSSCYALRRNHIIICSSCVSSQLLVSSLRVFGIASVLCYHSTSIIVYNMDWNHLILLFSTLKAEWYSFILISYFQTHLNVYLNQLNISFGIQLLAGRLQVLFGSALILGSYLSIAGRINRCIHHRDYVVSTGIYSIPVSSIDRQSSGCSYAMGIISFSTILGHNK